MRTGVYHNGEIKYKYPDAVCFVFNPNYLEIECYSYSSLKISVALITINGMLKREKTVNVSLYGGKANVYLSRLYELMFEEPEHTRSLNIRVSVKSSISSTTFFTFDTLVIWGSLAPGERFNAFGVYNDDPNSRYFKRNLVWFKNFPFQVSVFKYATDVRFRGRFDGGLYGGEFDGVRKYVRVNDIDRFTQINESDIDSTFCDNPTKVTFYESSKQFLAYAGRICSNWSAYGHLSKVDEYIEAGSSNIPRCDTDYIISDENGIDWVYRYDGETLVNCGLRQSVGFCLLYPHDLFPNAKKTASIKYKIADELQTFSTFDKTFGYTFFQSGQTEAIVNLIIRDDTSGHYLRWIDNQGNIQFYLFSKGIRTEKTKLGANSIVVQSPLRGMHFHGMKRIASTELTISHKCCAVSLDDDLYSWISTIISAPIVDMYLGRDYEGNEIWIPVTIQDVSLAYDNSKHLHDIEIIFEAPHHTPQSL